MGNGGNFVAARVLIGLLAVAPLVSALPAGAHEPIPVSELAVRDLQHFEGQVPAGPQLAQDRRELRALWTKYGLDEPERRVSPPPPAIPLPDVDFDDRLVLFVVPPHEEGAESRTLVLEGDRLIYDLAFGPPAASGPLSLGPFVHVLSLPRAAVPVGPLELLVRLDGEPSTGTTTVVVRPVGDPGSLPRTGAPPALWPTTVAACLLLAAGAGVFVRHSQSRR